MPLIKCELKYCQGYARIIFWQIIQIKIRKRSGRFCSIAYALLGLNPGNVCLVWLNHHMITRIGTSICPKTIIIRTQIRLE